MEKENNAKTGGGLTTTKDVLYWLSVLVGLVMIAMQVLQFIKPSVQMPPELASVYPVILAAYVMVKELMRWVNHGYSPRIGEVFVVVWFGTLLALVVAKFALSWFGISNEYTIPAETIRMAIEVLGIYTASEISKILRKYHQDNHVNKTAPQNNQTK